MADFDLDSYLNRRYGNPGTDKIDALEAATESKLALLGQYRDGKADAARKTREATLGGMLGLDPTGVPGTVANMVASFANRAMGIGSGLAQAPFANAALKRGAAIPAEVLQAHANLRAGQATEQDKVLLATPIADDNLGAGGIESMANPAWDTNQGAPPPQTTWFDRVNSVEGHAKMAADVKKAADTSFLVDHTRQKAQETQFMADAAPGIAQVRKGAQDFTNGSLGGVIGGAAGMVAGTFNAAKYLPQAAVDHPVATGEIVAGVLPDALIGGYGGIHGTLAATFPDAQNTLTSGVAAYQKAHGGNLPPKEWYSVNGAKAAAWMGADVLSDRMMLNGGKGLEAAGESAAKVLTRMSPAESRNAFTKAIFGAANLAKRPATAAGAIVEGAGGEFFAEGAQQYLEDNIAGKESSIEDIYRSAATGALGGGGISSGVGMSKLLESGPAAVKPPAAALNPVDTPEQKATFDAAIASNDPSVFLDQASPSYNPVKAVSVLQSNNDSKDTTPEVKQANYQQAQTIVTDLDSQLENAKEDYQFARKSPAAKQAEVDFYKAELAKIDPADTEGKATYETMVAHYEGMLAPLTAAQVRSTEADLSRMDRQLKEARTVKGRMVPHVTPAAFAQQVAAVQAPVDPQDTEAITASKAAATSLINLSMASPELLTPEVAKQLYKSTSSGLDDSQREYLRVFSEARIAQNALQDSYSVHQTILYGDKKNDQAGLVQHRERITDALEAGNKKAAERGLKTLTRFAVDQAGKASAMQAALDSDAVQKNRQTVQVVKNKDTGQWEQYTGDIPLTEKERAANGGLNIHRGSGKIVGSIAAGATAISSAAAEMESAYGLKFGNVLNKANKTNTSSAPVQKTKESIQVPVVPSLSPSIDNKVLEAEERVNTKVLPLSAGKANWSRYAPAGTGYEVSTQGDTRFSALNAKLADGRTIEEAYQLDVKGFRDPAKLNQSWKDGKGKAPKTPLTPSQTWEAYKGLWQQWAKENPKLIQELRTASAGKTLTDKFAGTPVSQARALAEILAAEASHEATTQVDLGGTNAYAAKDQAKSNQATKFIGRGSAKSATARYAAAWGNRANTGKYTAEDKVFVSAEGQRSGRVAPDLVELGKATAAGSSIITDAQQDRQRPYNSGERQVAEFLESQGYVESKPGIWGPSTKAQDAPTKQTTTQQDTGPLPWETEKEYADRIKAKQPTKQEASPVVQESAASEATLISVLDSIETGISSAGPAAFVANKEQAEGIAKIQDFLNAPNSQGQIFVLEGKAGTGKTSLVQEAVAPFLKSGGTVVVAAVSHKAKGVLQQKLAKFIKSNKLSGKVEAHSLAGLLGMKRDEETGDFVNDPFAQSSIDTVRVLVVDEASMVNTQNKQILESRMPKGAKLIYLGDRNQIAPIEKAGSLNSGKISEVFTMDAGKNKHSLVTRVRQGEDSTILPYADFYWTNAEDGGTYVDPIHPDSRVNSNEMVMLPGNGWVDKVIPLFQRALATGNANLVKVMAFNNIMGNTSGAKMLREAERKIREAMFGSDLLEYNKGELLIMAGSFGQGEDDKVENSAELVAMSVKPTKIKVPTPDYKEIELDAFLLTAKDTLSGSTKTIPVLAAGAREQHRKIYDSWSAKAKAGDRSAWKMFWAVKEQMFAPVAYAYILTTHKAQGSTYDVSVVLEDNIQQSPGGAANNSRIMYTAITRASKLAVIVSNKNPEQEITVNTKSVPTKAQDVPTSPEFSKQADQNLEYLRNPTTDYTPAKATEIGAWAQSNIAALTKAMQDAGEDLDEADRLETLRSDMRWMVSKAKEMVEADAVLAENLGPQGATAAPTIDSTADIAKATAHIAGTKKLQGMTFRAATAQEMALYQQSLAAVAGFFPTTKGFVSFLVHEGPHWNAGAFTDVGGEDAHIITVHARELAGKPGHTPEQNLWRLNDILAHELAHVQDARNGWGSNRDTNLWDSGYQYKEAAASTLARKYGPDEKVDKVEDADRRYLAQWFGWVLTKFNNDPVQRPREMYAQLQALYAVHPDLMEKYLGKTYAAYQAANSPALEAGVAEDVPGDVGQGSTGTGGQPTTETDSTNEPRVPGVEPEHAATGKLSILARTSAEELPEGTLLGKVYQSINKAVAFLTQKETKVEKDEDIAKDRPLVSIANFLSRWNKEEVTPDSFFVNELSTEENLALNTFKEYATAWSEVAKADFIKGSLPNGAGNKIREDYLFHDPVQDFINADGSVDENLVTAVVASAYSWLVDSLNNPPLKLKDDILTMHGLKEDDTLTSKGRDDLARFATMEDTAINSMGDILVDLLGLQAGPKAPKDYLPKVSAAFGVHALRLLEAQGLIKRVTLQKATLTEYMPDLVLPDYASISYVEIVRAGKEDKFALEGDSRRIRDSVVGSQAVLDRLFGSEHSPAEASWKPIPFNQTKAKRTAQGISDKQHAIITEAQHHENRIIPAMWTALQVLGGAVILQVAGHVEYDETKIQKENQGSVMAQNLNLENQLEGMQQLVGQAEADSPLGLDQPFFANHEVWRNFRVGITTRNMNLQTSKIHRFMFFRPEWASTIRMDEDSKVEHFKVALAAAFGIKTDQQPNEQTVEMFDAMLAKADNRIVDLAMKLHADNQNPDSPLLSQEEKSAIGALSAGKEGMQTLQAMVALGIYLDALSQGKEDFTVHLLVGVDGKTNGPILSHLALGAAASPEELFKHMNRGGMFQKEGRFKNFNHWYQQATSLDLYEDLARVVLGAIPKNMPNMEAFYVITKDLLHNGKVTGAGRKIVKTPLTSFAFGSTIEKSLQNMQQAFLQGVIDRIESVANDPAGSVSREKLITSINALIKMGGNRYAELLAKDASIEELMGMEFSKAQKQALGDAFHIIMGDALESSMKTYFEVFMKRRDAVNGAIQTAYGVYAAIYQDLRNIELNRLMDSGEIGFTQTKDGREPWYDLTNAQEQALREKVADVLPRAHTAYTHGTDALKDGLMMAKSRRGVSQLPMHKVKAQLAQRFTDAKGKQVSHIDTRAMTTSETSPGVAGLPYFMHSLDSFIMHMSLQGTESLNVHDEAANGADKVTGTAKAINGATWTGMLNFSPATEAYEMLERSLVNAVKLLESGDITQASLDLIRAAFLKQIPYKIRKQVKPENIALVAMQMAKGHQYKAEEIRLSTLVQMGYLDQYTWEGGEYEVTDADTAAAQAKLDALDKLMTYESDQAAEALGKAFKAGIKTKPVTVIVEADPTSSGMDDIDASDPNEETAASPVPPVLAGISTQELYAALPSTVSGTFDGHLKGLLDGMVSKLHGPFGSFKQAIMAAQPLGPLERMAKAQAEGKAPLSVSALASGIRFSDQEAFVMEQVQATVKATLEGNDGQTAITYGELSKLFMEAKKRIVPADFATGDPAQDQAIHDFLFNHTDAGKGNRSDYLARFAAVGLAHEGFNKLLQVETSRAAPVLKGEKTIAAFLKRAFDSLLDWFNGRMSNTQPGQKGSEKLTALVEQLVQIELKRQARAADTSFDIVDAFDEKSKALADGVATKMGEIGKSAFFQKSKSNVIKASGSLVSMVAEDRVKWMVEGMNKFRDQYMDKEQGVISAVFKDIVGYAAQQQVLLRMAVKNQGERKDIITNTTKLVRESFVNQGKDLSDKAKGALTSVLLRTGAHTLLSPTFDTVQLQDLLTDANKLTAAIKAQEAKLGVFPARFQNYFLRQSKDLAHYLVHSEAKGQHLMLNAGNIARMYETIHQGKLSEVETQQAEAIIDSLVSLYALKMSSTDAKAEVVTMMKAEHARGDGGNGVQMALLLHKDMEQQAKERLFGDSPALMVKGYTPEIYNPYTAIQVADSEEGKLLLEKGYMASDYVKQDPDDPREEQKRIYVLRDGGAAPLQTGILSYTGTRHKGSTLHSGKNVKMQKQVLLDKQAAIDKMFEPNPTYDPAKGRGTHMVPLLNANGKAVNYHYLMTAKTKDALLERNSRFDDVLGVQAGSVFDKATVGEQNRKAIQALKDSYLEDFKNNPQAYVQVGPTSPDAENRELYKLLPKVTQQAITDIWGKEGLMVRSDHKDLYFGYHKLSLSSAWDKDPMSFSNPDFWNTDPTRRNIGQQVLVSSVTWALEQYARNYLKMGPTKAREYAKRGAVVVRRGENIWQAVVREIKDIYVIKAVTSMLNNIGSNLSLLSLHGVPVMDSLRYHQEAMRGVSDYERDTTELFRLEQQIKIGMGDVKASKQRISELNDAIARNPVKPLIDAGLMPTIVEDVEADVDPFSYKSQFLRKTEKYTSKLNPGVRKAARVAFMAHDTQAYKTLHHFTQLSDFVARYALYQHLTTRKKNALASPEALHAASEAFIFYDIPLHRKLQYVEDMGLMMFTKYFIRIQRVLAQRVKENPGRVLISILTHHFIGGVPGVMDASAIAHFGRWPLSTGALGFPGALPDLGTVQAMDGMLGLLK